MKQMLKLILGLLVVYLVVRILIAYLRPVRVELQEQAEPPPPPPSPPPAPPPPAPAPERVNLNQADATALAALPGVGPALAQRILAHRQQSGPFASLDDLTQVRGIGPALVTRLRPLATVDS
jgi:competence ComEA-like helix-hairpin-helix protein